VVPEREHVRTRGEQAVGQLRRDARAVGDVLGVDDAEAGAQLFPEPGQALLDRAAAGRAEDVCDEENYYGKERAAAGWTETETWFPASGV
jgi:hypothetical protein